MVAMVVCALVVEVRDEPANFGLKQLNDCELVEQRGKGLTGDRGQGTGMVNHQEIYLMGLTRTVLGCLDCLDPLTLNITHGSHLPILTLVASSLSICGYVVMNCQKGYSTQHLLLPLRTETSQILSLHRYLIGIEEEFFTRASAGFPSSGSQFDMIDIRYLFNMTIVVNMIHQWQASKRLLLAQ